MLCNTTSSLIVRGAESAVHCGEAAQRGLTPCTAARSQRRRGEGGRWRRRRGARRWRRWCGRRDDRGGGGIDRGGGGHERSGARRGGGGGEAPVSEAPAPSEGRAAARWRAAVTEARRRERRHRVSVSGGGRRSSGGARSLLTGALLSLGAHATATGVPGNGDRARAATHDARAIFAESGPQREAVFSADVQRRARKQAQRRRPSTGSAPGGCAAREPRPEPRQRAARRGARAAAVPRAA